LEVYPTLFIGFLIAGLLLLGLALLLAECVGAIISVIKFRTVDKRYRSSRRQVLVENLRFWFVLAAALAMFVVLPLALVLMR
jgi:hypothetical protein